MGKIITGVLAATVSFLPFVSALLFFAGDKYHDTRIRFWDHDPSMFPESVADKISLGSQVVSVNVLQSVVIFSLSTLTALAIILFSSKFIEKLGNKVNPLINRWVSTRFSNQDNEKYKPSESEFIVFVLAFIIYIGVIVSIAFTFIIFKVSGISKNLATDEQFKLIKRYECSLKGEEICEKEGLSALRLTTFILKDRVENGFAIECSISNCILFTDAKTVVGVSTNSIQRRETAPPIVKD